jgi:tryptophan-rich sensory protein
VRDLGALVIFCAVVAVAALFGALFVPGSWYEALHKPPLNPPNWIFGPVWSVLYLTVAVAGWLVWQARPATYKPLALWGAQLTLNAVWSFLFFELERPDLALVDIVLLTTLIAATSASFIQVRRSAGLLFVPYLAWVCFAAYLNAGIWYLNR